MDDDPDAPVQLSDDDKALLVEKRATCPFVGAAISQGSLPVRNSASDPLASIEDIRTLGNAGGGDLGDLLVLFASGNHMFMLGDTGTLDKPAPAGLFSLEFPGSQGSHPGHSGILEGDPAVPGSGRLSEPDFARLVTRAAGGLIKRSDVARFIAENLFRDPNSKVLDENTAALLAGDVGNIAETAGSALVGKLLGPGNDKEAAPRELEEKLTKLTGEDNLVGSAGEFGLLFAFLANKPGAAVVAGEPAVAVEDLRAMFVDKRLPTDWQSWKKSRIDWVTNTTWLMIRAGKEYRILKQSQ